MPCLRLKENRSEAEVNIQYIIIPCKTADTLFLMLGLHTFNWTL